MIEAFRRTRRPLVIGHRGAREDAPENTLASIELAIAARADAIEVDVRLCRSGELVVCHDPDLARVTDKRDPRPVAALALSELRRVDVGDGQTVPLLSEVLDLARRAHLRVVVEMKRDVPSRSAVARATARLLRGWDPRHPVMVSSFDPAMLMELGARAPRIPRALLVHRSWYDALATRAPSVLRVDALHAERTIARPPDVKRWREARVLYVWTVNDEREAVDLARLGVDGLITDRPGAIREALS